MEYRCALCDYNTSIIYNYNKHLLTKKHEKKELENKSNSDNKCVKCDKILSSKQKFDNHKKICRGVKSLFECSKCNKVFNLVNSRYKHETKCDNNKVIIYNNQTPTVNNTIIYNTNNITNNIVINNFGSEKIDYLLEHPDFITFMNNCVENKTAGICNLIAKKHFDPEHPENHNIRKLNKKDNFLEIYKNNKWNTKNYKEGLDHITIPLETTFSIFMEKIVGNNNEIREHIFQHFMKEVGCILGWDLSAGNYNFSFANNKMQNDMSEKSKRMLKTKIYKLFCECIYNYTKLVHKM